MIAHLKGVGNKAVQEAVNEAEHDQQLKVQEEARDASAKASGHAAHALVSVDTAAGAIQEGQAIEIDRAAVRHSKLFRACMQ